MTITQYNKFQKEVDKAFNALTVLKSLSLEDKSMSGTSAMNQYDMLDIAQRKLEIVSIRKHEKHNVLAN
jgi:hypothetical protein